MPDTTSRQAELLRAVALRLRAEPAPRASADLPRFLDAARAEALHTATMDDLDRAAMDAVGKGAA